MPNPIMPASMGAAGAAGAAATGAGLPWSIILPIVLSLFGGALSEDPEEKKQRDFQTLLMNLRQAGIKPPYQSPYIGSMDKIMAEALAANLGRYTNWGMPQGMNIDLSFLKDFNADPGANRSIFGTLPGTVRRR